MVEELAVLGSQGGIQGHPNFLSCLEAELLRKAQELQGDGRGVTAEPTEDGMTELLGGHNLQKKWEI